MLKLHEELAEDVPMNVFLHLRKIQKLNWVCNSGHVFESSIKNRLSGRNCPYCAGRKILVGFNDVFTKHPEILKDFDQELSSLEEASKTFKTSSTTFFWKCPNGHSYPATLLNKIKGRGCIYCGGSSVLTGFNDLHTLFPQLSQEWSPKNSVKPCEVSAFSHRRVWWVCGTCSFEWEALVQSRTQEHSGCPLCASAITVQGVNDIFTVFPESAVYWDWERNTVDPGTVAPKSHKKVWWTCPTCSRSWQSEPCQQTVFNDCRFCSQNVSRLEKKVFDELRMIYSGLILHNKRPLTDDEGRKREIDFFLPEIPIAFEVQDFATHDRFRDDVPQKAFSKGFKKGPTYHLKKQELCREQLNCELFELWEDEILSDNFPKQLHTLFKTTIF